LATEDPSDFRDDRSADFLGAFAVVRRAGRTLMVQNTRSIGGRDQNTWDLPGGQVEPGELLHETLARELLEETDLHVVGVPEFLFVQEGEKRAKARRTYAWRSFFFAVEEFTGEAVAMSEILDVRWMEPDELSRVLTAPYHDSFRTWLAAGGRHFLSAWED
jgi:ADP-ribose pyrophosphatase YjhB (NUDIX family)